jgi:hypothetical protein
MSTSSPAPSPHGAYVRWNVIAESAHKRHRRSREWAGTNGTHLMRGAVLCSSRMLEVATHPSPLGWEALNERRLGRPGGRRDGSAPAQVALVCGEVPPRTSGGQIEEIRAGDIVYAPADQWHWHGATPGHFMTPLLHHRSRPRRPAPGSRLGRACHRRRIQPALIRNVTVSGPAADGDTDRAQSEGVLVRPPSYDPQRHITTGPASFSASFMRPVQPTIAAGRRAVITGPSWRWQRGEPGFRSPYGRNGRYSGKLFRWLPVGLPALSFNIGTSL